MKFTKYFLYIKQRPDRAKIKIEWIEDTIKNPNHTEIQSDGRIRKWKRLEKANFFGLSSFRMEKLFIMLSLIEDLREGKSEGKIFFGYRYRISGVF